MRQVGKRSLGGIVILLLLLTCNANKESSDNKKLLQEYQTSTNDFTLWFSDQGAFGSSVILKICDSKNNRLIEEITLRGEDYLPKIDSVVENSVYIHYSFPRRPNEKNITLLDFESVVLGEALLNKRHLKYNYVFTNKAPQH